MKWGRYGGGDGRRDHTDGGQSKGNEEKTRKGPRKRTQRKKQRRTMERVMKEGEERDESCKDELHEKREVWQDGVPQDIARDEEPPPRHTTGSHVPPRPRNGVEYKQVPPKGCVLLPNTSYFECLPHPQAQGFSASVNNSRGKTGLKSPTWHLLRLPSPRKSSS